MLNFEKNLLYVCLVFNKTIGCRNSLMIGRVVLLTTKSNSFFEIFTILFFSLKNSVF